MPLHRPCAGAGAWADAGVGTLLLQPLWPLLLLLLRGDLIHDLVSHQYRQAVLICVPLHKQQDEGGRDVCGKVCLCSRDNLRMTEGCVTSADEVQTAQSKLVHKWLLLLP